MKTIICIALVVCVGVAYGSVVPPPESPEKEQESNIQPAAADTEELVGAEQRWGGGGWGGRGYGGGWGRGRGYGGGWGGGYGGGWGGGYRRGYGWGR